MVTYIEWVTFILRRRNDILYICNKKCNKNISNKKIWNTNMDIISTNMMIIIMIIIVIEMKWNIYNNNWYNIISVYMNF